MTIHLGRRASREGWISFETDSRLTQTKARLHARCLPCLTALSNQLKSGADPIALGMAWHCWKVVAVVRDEEEGLRLLESFGQAFPGEHVYGKLGTGKGRTSFAVMFHTEEEKRRDELYAMMGQVVERHFPKRRVFYSRGCGDPYERLLGPWQTWQDPCPIRHPERIGRIRADLRESLYGRA